MNVCISPDGALIAYVLQDQAVSLRPRGSQIWCCPAAAGPPRQLTFGDDDHSPRWSPDGATLAFVGARTQGRPAQIHLLPMAGGEPRQLTDHPTDVSLPQFTRDGAHIGFIAELPEVAERKRAAEEGNDAIVFGRTATPRVLSLASVKTGRTTALSPPEVSIWEYAFLSGTQQAVVIYSDGHTLDDCYFRPRLGLLNGDVRRITPLAPELHGVGRIAVDPAGRRVAFVAADVPVPAGGELCVLSLDSGEVTNLTPALAATVESAVWEPDGEALIVRVSERTVSRLYRVAPDSPGRLEALPGETPPDITEMNLHASSGLVLCASGPGQPHEVWTQNPTTGATRRRTRVNARLARLPLPKHSEVRWAGPDGDELDGVLTLPPRMRKGKRYPLVIAAHGGPAGRWPLWFEMGQRDPLAAEGYVVLQPNPRGSTGRGHGFVRASFGDWGHGDLADILAGVDHLIAEGIADPERVAIIGTSYGGFMVAAAITTTDRFAAAVCISGVTNLFSFHALTDVTPGFLSLYFGEEPFAEPEVFARCSPMSRIGRAKTPTLVLHGEADVRVPVEQGKELHVGLKSNGVPTELVIYPREGHAIAEANHVRDMYRRILEWLARYV